MSTESTTTTDVAISSSSIALSDVAAEKVSALLKQEGRDDLSLRVAVQPGVQAFVTNFILMIVI